MRLGPKNTLPMACRTPALARPARWSPDLAWRGWVRFLLGRLVGGEVELRTTKLEEAMIMVGHRDGWRQTFRNVAVNARSGPSHSLAEVRCPTP